jgi:hypothetical protein
MKMVEMKVVNLKEIIFNYKFLIIYFLLNFLSHIFLNLILELELIYNLGNINVFIYLYQKIYELNADHKQIIFYFIKLKIFLYFPMIKFHPRKLSIF